MVGMIFIILCLVGLTIFLYFRHNKEIPILILALAVTGFMFILDVIGMLLGNWPVELILIGTIIANVVVRVAKR
jgi:hypothetical protein